MRQLQRQIGRLAGLAPLLLASALIVLGAAGCSQDGTIVGPSLEDAADSPGAWDGFENLSGTAQGGDAEEDGKHPLDVQD